MYYRFLIVCLVSVCMLGCSRTELSKEAVSLQGKSPDAVVYTYDEIMSMSDAELDKNIADLQERLRVKRSKLPPSVAGTSVGGDSSSPDTQVEEPEAEVEPDADDGVSVQAMALPLEVMLQEQKSRKK